MILAGWLTKADGSRLAVRLLSSRKAKLPRPLIDPAGVVLTVGSAPSVLVMTGNAVWDSVLVQLAAAGAVSATLADGLGNGILAMPGAVSAPSVTAVYGGQP